MKKIEIDWGAVIFSLTWTIILGFPAALMGPTIIRGIMYSIKDLLSGTTLIEAFPYIIFFSAVFVFLYVMVADKS